MCGIEHDIVLALLRDHGIHVESGIFIHGLSVIESHVSHCGAVDFGFDISVRDLSQHVNSCGQRHVCRSVYDLGQHTSIKFRIVPFMSHLSPHTGNGIDPSDQSWLDVCD